MKGLITHNSTRSDLWSHDCSKHIMQFLGSSIRFQIFTWSSSPIGWWMAWILVWWCLIQHPLATPWDCWPSRQLLRTLSERSLAWKTALDHLFLRWCTFMEGYSNYQQKKIFFPFPPPPPSFFSLCTQTLHCESYDCHMGYTWLKYWDSYIEKAWTPSHFLAGSHGPLPKRWHLFREGLGTSQKVAGIILRLKYWDKLYDNTVHLCEPFTCSERQWDPITAD